VLVVATALSGCYAPTAAGPSQSPTDESSSQPGASSSESSALQPSPTFAPTAEQTVQPAPEPTAEPTPKPTPKPTKPPLPWRDSGSIDVPDEIHAGTRIRFRLWDFSAPATCSLKFTWPDNSVMKLPTKTARNVGAPTGSSNPYGIDWYLDIPSSQVGDGKFDYVCSYLGKVRLDSWYVITIQAP